MLHTFTVPNEVGDDFSLSFPGDDRVFVTTYEQLFILRFSDAAILAKKKLKGADGPLPFGGDKIVVKQSDKKAPIVLDARNLKTLATLTAHKKTMGGANLALDPTGRYAATGAYGGEVLLHDLETMAATRFVFPKWPKQQNNPCVDLLAFSHDGKHLIAYASDLKGQVRVLSVPELTEVFVSRTDGHHSLRTFPHLSKDQTELVLEHSYFGDDGEWEKFEIVTIGEKSAKEWTGHWNERDAQFTWRPSPELLGAQWHLIYKPLSASGEALPPYKVLYVGKPVARTFSWGTFEGFLSGRTVYYWDGAKPLPSEIELAAEGEAFLEIVVGPKGDEKAVAKKIGDAVQWEEGTFPWYDTGKRAHLKLDRAKAHTIAERVRAMPKVRVNVL